MRTTRIIVAITPATLAALALAAPLLWRDHALVALSITQFFSFVCHQDPARSFWIAGAPVALCARCLGIYLGALIGPWVRIAHRAALRFVFVAAAVNAIDIATEMAGLHGNWAAARLGLGIVLGASLGAALVSAMPRVSSDTDFCLYWRAGRELSREFLKSKIENQKS